MKEFYDDLDYLDLIDLNIITGWGMSELSPLALLNPLDEPKDGSCGLACPNTRFKVVDVSTGKNLGAHKEGEICCQGPMVLYILSFYQRKNTKLYDKQFKTNSAILLIQTID